MTQKVEVTPLYAQMPLYCFARDMMGFWYVKDSPLNMEMAEFCQRIFHAWMDTRDILRKRVKAMMLVPRKGRKTTICTISGPPYLLCYNPDLSIVIDSEKKERASSFLSSAARVMAGDAKTMWKTTKGLGCWKAPDGTGLPWRDDYIVVNTRKQTQRKEPSLISSSVEIGYTGGAPDAIIIDDPMSPESHTEYWMRCVTDHYDGYGPVLMPNGLFFINMTRYDDGDLAGYIERNEGWHVCGADEAEACIRAGECTERTEAHPEPWHVMVKKALGADDKSIDETVWPTSFLHAERKKYPAFFAAQYLNDPWDNPDASFQKEDFVYCKPEEVPRDITKVLTSDTAWKTPNDRKTERAGDWNVFIRAHHQRVTGKVYVFPPIRGRWTMGEWGDELVKILREERRDRVPISRFTYEELRTAKGAIQEAVRSACQRWSELAPALIIAPRSSQLNAKGERIKSTAQYFQNHQVIFVRPCGIVTYDHDCRQCATLQVLRNEMLKFGATTFDDCADAMADHFLPDVYHAPPVVQKVSEPPRPLRPYDDALKPIYEENMGMTMMLDEHDKPYWLPNDRFYPIDPI